MNIIPVGKSNSFKSELSDWKDAFVAQYAKNILQDIPYLEVDANAIEEIRKETNSPDNCVQQLTKEEAEKRADERTRSEHFRKSFDERLKDYVEASCGMPHKKKSKDSAQISNKPNEASCGCDCNNSNDEAIIIKKKKNKPLKNIIKEGDPPMDKSSSFNSINDIKKQLEEKIAKLDTKLSMMDQETRDKLIAFWADDLGLPKEWAEALVKSYY